MYQAYEEFGEQVKRAAKEKDTREGRVFRPDQIARFCLSLIISNRPQTSTFQTGMKQSLTVSNKFNNATSAVNKHTLTRLPPTPTQT